MGPGESLKALSAPAKEASSGLLRVRVSAEKDGQVGYATVRGDQGTILLEPESARKGPIEKPGTGSEKSIVKPTSTRDSGAAKPAPSSGGAKPTPSGARATAGNVKPTTAGVNRPK